MYYLFKVFFTDDTFCLIFQNAQTAIRNMNNTINRLDQDALKQEGLLYNQVSGTDDY